jgi:DNA-directed RNA polymerase subunit RPC12/RpoP
VRELVREARERGWSVAIATNYESLNGSRLQRTLLRQRKVLRNLALYEGARFELYRVSGKRCPICGAEGVAIGHRRYRCPYCNIKWDLPGAALQGRVQR